MFQRILFANLDVLSDYLDSNSSRWSWTKLLALGGEICDATDE